MVQFNSRNIDILTRPRPEFLTRIFSDFLPPTRSNDYAEKFNKTTPLLTLADSKKHGHSIQLVEWRACISSRLPLAHI